VRLLEYAISIGFYMLRSTLIQNLIRCQMGSILILGFLNFQDFVKNCKPVYQYLIPILEISLFIVQAFFLKFGFAKFPVLYLEKRVEKNNFFLEHKNQIMLLLIGGIVTLTVQILLQYIKNIYFK
ncbi:hypothetical protein, partial [Nostoc sp.]|uniref:hypothetical protein n=1 Tax=Nostoc sp. TaxID=1180 RepID=UPI002FF837D1